MANDTKERILDAALTSFAEKGYEGTNLLDIADFIHLCDREPAKEEEALKTIKEYAEHFVKTYGA